MMNNQHKKSPLPNDLSIDLLREMVEQFALVNSYKTQKYILDTADLKQQYNLSDSTIYRWRRDGKIKYIKLGGKYYYSRISIESQFL